MMLVVCYPKNSLIKWIYRADDWSGEKLFQNGAELAKVTRDELRMAIIEFET